MNWNRTNGAIAIALSALAVAVTALLALHDTPEGGAAHNAQTAPQAASPQSNGIASTKTEPQPLPPCESASPFGKSFGACAPTRPDEALDETATANMTPMPDFEKIQVVGMLGSGVVAAALRSSTERLGGTAQNHDSMLVDATTMAESDVAASIKTALDTGKYIIVDGGDSTASSAKVNKIMTDMQLINVKGVTAFGVMKGPNDQIFVTPLHSLADEKGNRPFNQIDEVLGISKT